MEDKKGKRGIISNIQHPISNYEVRRQKPGKGKSKKVHKSTRHKSSSQGLVNGEFAVLNFAKLASNSTTLGIVWVISSYR